MKFAICLLPERGHINPFIGLAQALIQQGHEVITVAGGDISEQMQRAGVPFAKDLIPKIAPPIPRGQEFAELMDNHALHRVMIAEVFLNPILDQMPGFQSFLLKQKPDAVIIDPMNYPAILAALNLQLPWIGVSSSLTSVLPDDLQTEIRRTVEALGPKREAIFKKFGEVPKFRAVDALSRVLNISFSTPEFIGPPPSDVEAVGPSRPLKARGDERPLRNIPNSRPVVYASFGSQVYYQPEIFKKIKSACKDLDVHLILSVGDLASQPEWQDSEFVQVYDYAPQTEILKSAKVFITHGGANSVAESLTAGVPMLIYPICNDQVHQAYFAETSGTGKTIDLKTATTAEIRTAIESLLNDSNQFDHMKVVTESYQTNGAIKAAKRIVEVLSR